MTDSRLPLRRWATEFVVIATGVFVGLAAEGWAEGRREAREAREMLALVAADLRADSIDVAETRRGLREVLEVYPDFLEALRSPPQEWDLAWEILPQRGARLNPTVAFRTGGYNALLSSGRMAALEPELAAGLSNLYDYEMEEAREMHQVVEFAVNSYFTAQGRVLDYLSGRVRPSAEAADFTNEATRYRSIISILQDVLDTLQAEISRTRSEVLAAVR